MTEDGPDRSANAFEADLAKTPARSQVEAAIEGLKQRGGMFVEAVRATRMPMAMTAPGLPGNPIVFANASFLRLSGYSLAEVLGQRPSFMNGKDTDEAEVANFGAALEQDRDEVIETVQYRKDGSRFVASVFLSAFRDEEGQTLHQFLSYLDITSRVAAEQQLVTRKRIEARLRESEARLGALAAASSEALYHMSPDWGEMRELTGGGFLANTTSPSRAWLMDYIPPEDQDRVTAAIGEAIRTKGVFELEHRVLRADGSTGWSLSRAVPVLGPDGAIVEWFGAASDITERKQAEDGHAFLLNLSDALRPLADPAAIQGEAARVLGLHLGAGHACYGEIDEEARREGAARGRSRDAGHARRHPFRDWPMPWPDCGKTLVVRDTARDPALTDEQRAFHRENGIGALIVVPLVKEGRLVASLLTDGRKARNWTAEEIRLVEETAERTWAASERARAGAALRDSEARHRAILGSVLDYAIFTTDADGRIETWPAGAEAVFGWSAEQAIGRDMAVTFMAEDRDNGVPGKERATARETGFVPNVRWHLRKDGRRVFIEGSTRPMRGDDGRLRGYLKVGQDITERRQWEERQDVLLAELQHRTRNLMSVVLSMFDETRRTSGSVEELAVTYKERMAALARVQGLLSRLDEGDRITFDELIHIELAAMGAVDGEGRGERVVVDGPRGVRLRSGTVQTFALALHELATNAIKYGALAQPGGRLSVRWRLLHAPEGPRLRIEWKEDGVRMPEPGSAPRGSGYGRKLIERALPYQLQAETSYELGAEGVRCTIELPVSEHTRVEGDGHG